MIYRILAFFIIILAIFIPTTGWMTVLKWGIAITVIVLLAHLYDLGEQKRYTRRTQEISD